MRAAALAAVLVASAGAMRAEERTLTVSAAVSLTNVLEELASTHQRQTGTRVILNFGASNVLARQIDAGARVDLFISANAEPMDRVAARLDSASRVDLLVNQLAIAVPDDRQRRVTSAGALTDPGIRRIAIGDPAGVPAGIYAKAYLEKLGLWAALAPKMVPTASVRLALAAVEQGVVDAAIVYKTDVAAARRVRVAFVVPRSEGPPVVYPAAVVRGAPNEAGAKAFLRFLQSAEAVVIFERSGFSRP